MPSPQPKGIKTYYVLSYTPLIHKFFIKGIMIVSSTLAIILFNTLFLIILNKNSYASKSIRPQPRIIFTTLALNDLANGLLVLGVGIFPATFQCWPFGEFLCQIQVR